MKEQSGGQMPSWCPEPVSEVTDTAIGVNGNQISRVAYSFRVAKERTGDFTPAMQLMLYGKIIVR